jgi:hypothetical protein
MQCIPLNDLSHIDFDIRNITSRKEEFSAKDTHNYLEHGRSKNLLHIVTSGNRLYQTEGYQFTVPAGTILFIPDGTQYLTRSPVSRDCPCSGIGICFDLYDSCGRKLQLEHGVYHSWSDYHSLFIKLFLDISRCCLESSYYVLRTKSLMFQLLSQLVFDSGASQLTRSIIAPALTFLSLHYRENLPVKAYADVCNMS